MENNKNSRWVIFKHENYQIFMEERLVSKICMISTVQFHSLWLFFKFFDKCFLHYYFSFLTIFLR